MGKRPRTPHFITGIGDGNVNVEDASNNKAAADDVFLLRGNAGNKDGKHPDALHHMNKNERGSGERLSDRYIRTRNERLMRLEEPLLASDHWKDVFSGDVAAGLGKPPSNIAGPWQVSAFAILGMIVVLSAIFLHIISESSSETHTPYSYRRRQRHARRMYKTRKKKTDEWSDDEEPVQVGVGVGDENYTDSPTYHPYYYQPAVNPRFKQTQDHRLRRTGHKEPNTPPPQARTSTTGAGSHYYHQPAVVPTYKSPAATIYRRGVASPKHSFNSTTGQSPSASARGTVSVYSSGGSAQSPNVMRATAPLSGRNRVPTPPGANEIFQQSTVSHASVGSGHGSQQMRLPTTLEGQQLSDAHLRTPSMNQGQIQLIQSGISSFSGTPPSDYALHKAPSSADSIQLGELLGSTSSIHNPEESHNSLNYSYSNHNHSYGSSFHTSSRHQQSLILSPGNCEVETPRFGNRRRAIDPGLGDALQPPLGADGATPIPFIPALEIKGEFSRIATPPPRSVLLEELRLFQMETGNSMRWEVREASERHESSSHIDVSESAESVPEEFGRAIADEGVDSGSDISIPSGDPRKSIVHKRSNLTIATDAAGSLQSDINFDDLKLQEVIGGGGFGQVWRATWMGTPVAVKVLTGSAQNKHIAKAILQEFMAEINLLKGMRHPNICLYMGACVDPPNRAIVTELAANGSVWDALRLPLSPPYVPSDGTQRGCWPQGLYTPDHHGAPPTDAGVTQISSPVPPKGTWPWQLVKRVACGAARGMAYLHNGKPPVLHRDLKSANLLLDESYTTKVCDFGLSRLKAQERSMTGNCGTVQWMAPEVLANMNYNEKADVFSFGIILWELLSRECPYDGMTAIQCALAVLNRDKRPEIPKWCPPPFHALIKACVKKESDKRPSFEQIIAALDAMDG